MDFNIKLQKLLTESKELQNKRYSLQRRKKPILNSKSPTIEELEVYRNQLKDYNKQEKSLISQLDNKISIIDNEIEELIKKEAGLYSIPEMYRDNAYQYAYNKGHSNGWYEIFCELYTIVHDIFLNSKR